MSSDDLGVYKVDHLAFRTEYVVAESREEANRNAACGYDCGEFVYGDTEPGDRVCDVDDLDELDHIGSVTVARLLDADGPVPLGPASDTDAISKRTVTRLRNQLEQNGRSLYVG